MDPKTDDIAAYAERNASKLIRRRPTAQKITKPEEQKKRKARAEVLQSMRKELRLSQKALAEAVGANLRTLQSWESGRQDYPKSVVILMKLMQEMPAVRKKLSGKDALG